MKGFINRYSILSGPAFLGGLGRQLLPSTKINNYTYLKTALFRTSNFNPHGILPIESYAFFNKINDIEVSDLTTSLDSSYSQYLIIDSTATFGFSCIVRFLEKNPKQSPLEIVFLVKKPNGVIYEISCGLYARRYMKIFHPPPHSWKSRKLSRKASNTISGGAFNFLVVEETLFVQKTGTRL